jgi:Uma2 family endonuclease
VSHDVFYYPDISVVCREPGMEEWIAEQPRLVVEVASRSTRATDRREKLTNYRAIASLQHYLIVEQRRREVTAHFRDASGEWQRTEFVDAGRMELPFLGTSLTLDEIYEDVPMPAFQIREGMPGGYGEDDDIDDEDADDEI